jgi:pimeloyl-ACP methyl ester carboxylesterase
MRIDLPTRGLHLDYEWHGPEHGPVLILIMGLGMQRVAWPPELIAGLVARGLRVLTFDNRDIGLSGSGQIAPHMGVRRAFLRYLMHRPIRAPYTLDDMAADTLALVDALGIARFHVAGASMGGMIAQQLALAAPQRVLSLTSIMSSAGPRAAPFPEWRVLQKMLRAPAVSSSHAQRVEHFVSLFTELGRHHEAEEIERLRRGLSAALARAYRPAGTLRQLLAITADPDRSAALRALTTPTLIIHGAADPLVPVRAARHLASVIPNAWLQIVDRMGHDLPSWAMPQLIDLIAIHCGQRAKDRPALEDAAVA